MIILKIRSRIYPDKRNEFDQAIEYLLKLKDERREKFYRTFYEELDEPNMFCYVEEWESMPALKKHLQCERFKALFGAMKVLGEIDCAKIIQASREQDL